MELSNGKVKGLAEEEKQWIIEGTVDFCLLQMKRLLESVVEQITGLYCPFVAVSFKVELKEKLERKEKIDKILVTRWCYVTFSIPIFLLICRLAN